MKKTTTKLKAYLQKISKNKFFKIIRAVSLGLLLLVTFLRIFFTIATMIVTILVLRVGYGQSGDLPVRRDDAQMNNTVRYWYDEQGRLKEEVHFYYTTLAKWWPLTVIPIGMSGDEFRAINPFPRWREVWVYEEDSLDKTQYIYDSYFTTEENLQAVITYRHELDEQGRISFYEKSVDYHQAIQNGYIIYSFHPEKIQYEYDVHGKISKEHILLRRGEFDQYCVYSYENDSLVRKDYYDADDNKLLSYDLYFYSNGQLVKNRHYNSDGDETSGGVTYEYEEGRLIAEKGRYRYYY